MNSKEGLRSCHSLEGTKAMWGPSAVWDFGWDSETKDMTRKTGNSDKVYHLVNSSVLMLIS